MDRGVRTEPHDQLRNLFWMGRAIESDQTTIANPVAAQRFGHRQPFRKDLLSLCASTGVHRRAWTNHIATNAEPTLGDDRHLAC